MMANGRRQQSKWNCLFWISVIILPAIADKESNKLLPPEAIKNIQPYSCIPSIEFGCLNSTVTSTIQGTCPDATPKIWRSYAPRGQKAAGTYTELEKNVTTPEECASECCQNLTCHYAFTANTTCFLLNCVYGSYLCEPILFKEVVDNTDFSMVLVRTPKATPMTGITCEVGEGSTCLARQRCIPTTHRSRNGICVCDTGFTLYATTTNNNRKECIPETLPVVEDNVATSKATSTTTTTIAPRVELTVSVSSKNVTLPDNEVSLQSYVVPQAPADHPYSYKWTLVSNPNEDTAAVEGQTTDTLRLTGLKEGKYMFQVTASNNLQSNGSANATINVFAELKPNQAPIAVISPQEQTIQLPTSSAVMDASLSTDDDKIISYKWELQKSPILYALNPSKSLNSSTLQVENLIPGNYTFKLIVEDSGHVINSTTANITVIKEPDYPPTANPGKDIVIYLPQTEVILNGNASTDDKKIVEFEWKASGEQTRAIDMQDTHTPYLKLSHLQIGLYQFELKVTDEAGQSSSATVHVVVKEATGNPPKADAGTDQTTVLNKQNWMMLDGSKSKSDSNKITNYNWTQIRGPNNATITLIENGIRANVSGLTKGEYEFLLVVEDDSKLRANDTVLINVIQRVNEPPHANAGGNVQVKLPVSLVVLNGSASSDDVKIVNWAWERQPDSLAAGVILQGSEVTPILQLTDLVPGKYFFKLTVKDEQGAVNDDITTLTVTGESHEHDLIEVVLGVSLYKLTESDKNKVIEQLALLLHDTKLILNHIGSQLHSGNAILQLHGEDKAGKVINGSILAGQLRRRLYQDAGLLLQFPIYSIDTALCLDECSGHGICQDTSIGGRECVCSAFWMENVLKRKFGNKERNCEWSKIYVGVVVSLLLSMVFALMWSLSFIFRRNFRALKESPNKGSHLSPGSNGKIRHLSNKKQYTALMDQDDDEDEEMELRTTHEDEDDAESEGDSDSDILFETNNKRSNKSNKNGLLMIPLTGNGIRNGILKNARRAKT